MAALAVLGLGFLSGAPRASAQVFDATQLGHPRIDLGPGWRVHAGDDPAYAQPGFDDSHWTPFNAATGSLHDLFRVRPEVVWYRLHVNVPPAEQDLALRTFFVSSAYEVYTNGVPLMQVGSVSPVKRYDKQARLEADIPGDQIATGSLVIAVRVLITPVEWTDAYPGLRDWKLALGAGWGLRENTWLQMIGENAVEWLNDFILLCLALGALLLYSAQRKQAEYLWLALVGAVGLLPVPLGLYSLMHTFPVSWHAVDAMYNLFYPYVLARMYLAFAQRPLGWRLHTFLIVASVCEAFAGSRFWGTGFYSLFNAPAILLVSVVLPVILIVQFRSGVREAGILVLPIALTGIYYYVFYFALMFAQIPAYRTQAWAVFTFANRVQMGPFAFDPLSALEILASVLLALIILLRINHTSRQQALLETEMANARAVQQVLLPEHAEGVQGFEIESVYEPAQQVGGDFFQVLPAGDGGLLLVVGDVAGKGLPAAMLVSMLVGAFRTAAAYGSTPVEVLAQLNERLLGRASGGFSTALAVHIAADGALTMANAGHLAPYLDGREIELPGALPLGIHKEAQYETVRLKLMPGSRLTFYSDGVIEAQNQQGELFGFERGKALSTQPAAAIAAAAQQFGQLDDITVVAIRRLDALASAVAS